MTPCCLRISFLGVVSLRRDSIFGSSAPFRVRVRVVYGNRDPLVNGCSHCVSGCVFGRGRIAGKN